VSIAVVTVLSLCRAVRLEPHRPVHRLVACILDDADGAIAVERDVKVVHLAVDTVALQPPALEPLHHTVGRILHHLLIVAVLVRKIRRTYL